MFKRLSKKCKGRTLSIRTKLSLSLLSIAAILLISSVITILQYRSMSNYVSTLIADNIRNINYMERLADDTHAYNAQVMSVLWSEAHGDLQNIDIPELDIQSDLAYCDSLLLLSHTPEIRERAESLKRSFGVFSETSKLLPQAIKTPSLNTQEWYSMHLQGPYDAFRRDVFELNTLVYNALQANSATFDRGFYRSVIPGAVAIAVGLLLVLMLLLFASIYYINPLRKMLRGLDAYLNENKKYSNVFEGDDELSRLNEGITEIVNENLQLRKRVASLKEAAQQQGSGNNA